VTDHAPATDQAAYITITRTFNASPGAVFEAWTTPDTFGHWFGTAATEVRDVSMDLRIGGEWSALMILGDGMEIGWHGSYIEVDAPHRLVFSLSDRPGDQYEQVTVALKAVEHGTEMIFTQTGGNMPTENYAQAEEGWRTFFEDLDKGLAPTT
jgi:uncharacterized protein YndB with AHSA1/START domain